MRIPTEVLTEARTAFYFHHPVLTDLGLEYHAQVVAEWARKEALREAAGRVSRLYAGTDTDMWGRGYIAGVDKSAATIRALAEGEKTDD